MISLEELLRPLALPNSKRQALSDFLLAFSRFEFALKTVGFVEPRGDGLGVRRGDFADSIETRFAPSAEFMEAVQPLLEKPPARQLVKEGTLSWAQESPKAATALSLRWLLDMTYRIRNNLFHGAKWPLEPTRDLKLLAAGLAVLRECLDLHEDAMRVYRGGA